MQRGQDGTAADKTEDVSGDRPIVAFSSIWIETPKPDRGSKGTS